MANWNRTSESKAHRERRVKMIRQAQAKGQVLTHIDIDRIFAEENSSDIRRRVPFNWSNR